MGTAEGNNEIDNGRHGSGRAVVAFKGVFWSACSILMPAVVNFLVFLVTSRVLSPDDFGAVAMVAAITMFAGAIGPVGFGEALIQRAGLRPDHLDSVFWLCTVFGVVAYLSLCLGANWLGDLFGAPIIVGLIPVLGLRVLLQMINVVPNALIARSLDFHLIALRTFAATLIAASISIGLVLSGFGLWALVFSQLSASVVAVFATFWSANWRPRGHGNIAALRELAQYGIFASGNNLVAFLGNRAGQLAVGYVLGIRSAGIYNFARRISTMINDIVSGALGTVSHPLFSQIQDDLEKVRRGFFVATFVSSAVSFPIFIGIALVADRAVPLFFGDKWVEAVAPLRILCLLGIISSIGTLQASLIKSRGRADWWFYYQSVSSFLNVAIVLLLARYGISVMLAAIVTRAYLAWPFSVVMAIRLLSIPPWQYLRQFLAPLAATAAMCLAVLLVREATGETGRLNGLILDVAVGLTTYSGALFLCAPRRVLDIGGLVLRAAAVR